MHYYLLVLLVRFLTQMPLSVEVGRLGHDGSALFQRGASFSLLTDIHDAIVQTCSHCTTSPRGSSPARASSTAVIRLCRRSGYQTSIMGRLLTFYYLQVLACYAVSQRKEEEHAVSRIRDRYKSSDDPQCHHDQHSRIDGAQHRYGKRRQ